MEQHRVRGVRVIEPGLSTTVQDLGRWGMQQHGVSPGGAADPWSIRTANLLVGNDESAACLELTLRGPALEFGADALVAVCGAQMEARIGGEPIPAWRTVYVRAGQRLVVSGARRGVRAYLAVSGGWDVPKVLGSRSTDLRAGFGGYRGRALQAGDWLPMGDPSARALAWMAQMRAAAGSSRGWVASPAAVSLRWLEGIRSGPVRVLPGPEAAWFSEAVLQTLAAGTYTVTTHSDRMGVRLHGDPLVVTVPREMVSSPVTLGTVQVPPDGQPVVLLADRQTTGGYPRIAQVIRADLAKVAQWRPGDTVRFAWTTLDEALQALRELERGIALLRAALAGDGSLGG